MSIYKPTSGVAFDIDGIVLDTGTEMWKAITNHFEIPWTIDAWKEYYIEKQLGLPAQDLRRVYEPVLHRSDMPLVKGAAEALIDFYEATQEPLLFITARRPQFVEQAVTSMRREIKVPIEVVATSASESRASDKSGHDKTRHLIDHGVQFFIDDHPHSWQSYIDAGVCVATLEWPWTKEPASELIFTTKMFRMFKDWGLMGSFLLEGLGIRESFRKIRGVTLPL